MEHFEIEVCRTSHAFRTIIIEADTYDQAESRALDIAGNYDGYSETAAAYSVPGSEKPVLQVKLIDSFPHEEKGVFYVRAYPGVSDDLLWNALDTAIRNATNHSSNWWKENGAFFETSVFTEPVIDAEI